MTSNKLIAEFMGNKDAVNYKTSWDWLIPVVHKIKEIDLDFDVLESGLSIDQTYIEVVEFIKQYNKNNEQK